MRKKYGKKYRKKSTTKFENKAPTFSSSKVVELDGLILTLDGDDDDFFNCALMATQMNVRKDCLEAQLNQVSVQLKFLLEEKLWNYVFLNGKRHKIPRKSEDNWVNFSLWYMKKNNFQSLNEMLRDPQYLANLGAREAALNEYNKLCNMAIAIESELITMRHIKKLNFFKVGKVLNDNVNNVKDCLVVKETKKVVKIIGV